MMIMKIAIRNAAFVRVGHFAWLALTNHFVFLLSCVHLSDLYEYFHTVTGLWAWSLELLGPVYELNAMQEG